LEFFSKKEFGLNWWIKHLLPIIDKIVMTKWSYDYNKKISADIKNFWKDMVRVKFNGAYNPTIIDGWIVKFFPDLEGNFPKVYDSIDLNKVPNQIISCPVELKGYLNGCASIEKYNCDFVSGFYGMSQDEKTFNVRPVIGYALVVDKKESAPLSENDKKDLINKYFS